MWWDRQNLHKPRRDTRGKRWHFRVWHDVVPNGHAERVFFWDDSKEECGVVLLVAGKSVHVSKLHQLIDKLVSDRNFRERHRRDLSFPLERHYSEYGAFPEENSN
jgi:hypothetical protein